jgi:adenine/guanine phosphoribosyltransferase-like PRPP-binding protein
MVIPLVENFRAGEFMSRRSHLAGYIESKAKVVDARIGYVSIEEVNHRVDPMILKTSAEVTKGLFLDKLPEYIKPEVVIGVPNRGKEFATALGLESDLAIGVSDRSEIKDSQSHDFAVDYIEKDDSVIINGIPSFTQPGKYFSHKLRGIKPNSVVLVADDFSATGAVTEFYLKAFTELNITPIFVYMVAKDFNNSDPPQQGYRRNKEKGISVFSVVRLTNIEDGHVTVTSEDI